MKTVFDSNRPGTGFAGRLVTVGVGLILLFTVVAPEITQPLTLLQRAAFWTLHIGIGLATAVLVALFLSQRVSNFLDWRLIILSGIGGLILFAPIAYALEFIFPLTSDGADHEWSDRLAQSSLLAAVLVEAIELAPSYLAAWVLINLEPLNVPFKKLLTEHLQPVKPGLETTPPFNGTDNSTPTDCTLDEPTGSDELGLQNTGGRADAFLDRLPPIVGNKLVSVASDLHYLKVVTRKGHAMILGSLQEVEEAFEQHGLRVHRSHWVNLNAITKLRKSGSGWHLEMVEGPPVPVSRRKRAEVAKIIGADFKLTAPTPELKQEPPPGPTE
ncbi:MAG: LytTR family DNA-binding domain-containing protein [Gammaproteobacteria bacterium]